MICCPQSSMKTPRLSRSWPCPTRWPLAFSAKIANSQAAPDLKPADAKYGAYYLSASRLNYGEEESPALLLLWSKEEAGWKVVAWAVELP